MKVKNLIFKKTGGVFLFFMMFCLNIIAQNITVQGTVIDERGDPAIGATVMIRGTQQGTVAGIDGNFTLSAPMGSTLVISFIGYATQEVAASANINVRLQPDAAFLDELIVVGYGVQRRANLTGAVSTIGGEALTDRPIANVSNALQGLMPGLTVRSGSGRPGQDAATLRIRGVGTLNTGQAGPLILVDGVDTGPYTLNELNPVDIESITVLRDAGSAAIFGSRAANGVILITTRRGAPGAPRVTYSGTFGIARAANVIDRLSSYDHARFMNEVRVADGLTPRFSDEDLRLFRDGSSPYTHPNTRWMDLALRTGIQHRHTVSASGGTEHMDYMASVGVLSQQGLLPNSERQQFNGRINLGIRPNDRLGIRMNMSYTQNNHKDPTNSYTRGGSGTTLWILNTMAPWIVARYPDGTWGVGADGSAIAWLDINQTINRNNQSFTGMLEGTYRIIDGLTATLRGTYVGWQQHLHEFQKDVWYNATRYHGPNRLQENFWAFDRTVFDALLNFNRTVGQHEFSALAGWNTERYTRRRNSMVRMNFPNNYVTNMNAGAVATAENSGYTRELTQVSGFGRINYVFAGRYLFEANFRADASSRFAPENRWGYFPSFSAGWRVSEEEFMANTRDWLNHLRIRGSWGLLGDQQSGGDFFPWMVSYNIGGGVGYPLGGVIRPGAALTAFRIPTISWETSRNAGFGIDATFLGSFNLSIDYYDRLTSGILMNMPVPREMGFAGQYRDNVGSVLNRGIEVALGYNRRWGDFSMNLSANISYNHNRIVHLGYHQDGSRRDLMPSGNHIQRIGGRIDAWHIFPTDGLIRSQEEADIINAQFGSRGMFPRPFVPGDIRFLDVSGPDGEPDGIIDGNDRVTLGAVMPDYIFGFNFNFGFRQLDLSMIMSGALGGYSLMGSDHFGLFTGDASHPSTWWLDAWTPENPNTNVPRRWNGTNSNSHHFANDFWLVSNSFLRMANLQLGYTVPVSALQNIGISRLRVFYSGENLFTIDRMPVNIDPEVTSASAFPRERIHSIGINITL